MEHTVPSWLDKEFLTKVLQKSEDESNLRVVGFNAKPAMLPGNNYLSHMYRVKVEYETGGAKTKISKSLMVKVPIEEGFLKTLSDELDIYAREPTVYRELMPNLSRKAGCGFGPSALYSPVTNVLVLEDLKEAGYVVCDKFKQLDYIHCAKVVKKLAKFHASSVACLHDHPTLVNDVVGKELYWTKDSPMEPMVKPSIANLVKTFNETDGAGLGEIADCIVERVDRIWSSSIALTQPKLDGGFNVLNHGDLWTNNMLFKYNDSGEIVDVKFIDFQVTRFASPVNDLVYFLWTSADEDVLGKRQKTLYHLYLDTLNKTLQELGCTERLTVEELTEDLERATDWALLVISHLLPIMLADPEDAVDFVDLTVEDFASDKFKEIYRGKSFNNRFMKSIKHCAEFFFNGNYRLGYN